MIKFNIALILFFLSTPVFAKSDRFIFAISDTHLGIGKIDSEFEWNKQKWDAKEDFRWHQEFDEFIKFLISKSSGNADLVIGGDFLELWQSRDKRCDHRNKNLGCNEEESLTRVKRIIKQHKQVFDSLNSFINEGDNKIIIIPGNHDAALMYKNVEKFVLSVFNKKNKVIISKNGYWLNKDKSVIIDHGQQLQSDVNKFNKWPNPFIDYKGTIYLQKTWGEQFVQKFFNDFEDEIPLIDNISSEFDGFKAGIEFKKWKELKSALTNGILFFFKHMSLNHTTRFLAVQKKEVNPKKVKEFEKEKFFYNSIHSDTFLYKETKALVDSGIFKDQIKKIPNDEIQLICNYRRGEYQLKKSRMEKITIYPCRTSNNSLSAIAAGIFTKKSNEKTNYIFNLEKKLKAIDPRVKFKTYIYGHTHKYEKKRTHKKGNWTVNVLNTGAWQRIVSLKELKIIAKRLNINDPFKVDLEKLPACYTYIVISPYESIENQNAILKKWGRDCNEGEWKKL